MCLLSRTRWSTCLEQKWRSIMPHLFEKIVMRKTSFSSSPLQKFPLKPTLLKWSQGGIGHGAGWLFCLWKHSGIISVPNLEYIIIKLERPKRNYPGPGRPCEAHLMCTHARILRGEGGTEHVRHIQNNLRLLHIAAFKSQRNFCNGHAGIWYAVLRHNRTMRWFQSYGLLVIQDQKVHSTVIKVPTVFKAPPPHPPRNLSQML